MCHIAYSHHSWPNATCPAWSGSGKPSPTAPTFFRASHQKWWMILEIGLRRLSRPREKKTQRRKLSKKLVKNSDLRRRDVDAERIHDCPLRRLVKRPALVRSLANVRGISP